jgi:predicted RNase H-like HicB family nuclease
MVLIEDSLMNPIHTSELVFEVTEQAEGGYSAECLTENIFTQGTTWDELRANVREATEAYFYDAPRPKYIRLHLVRNEVLTMG